MPLSHSLGASRGAGAPLGAVGRVVGASGVVALCTVFWLALAQVILSAI